MTCGRCPGACGCRQLRGFGAIEAQCSGRYAALVNNGIGGTINQPCANAAGVQLYCNDADVAAWNGVAWDLFGRVRRAWNDTASAGFQIPPLVKEYITALENDFCESGPDGVCVTYKLPQGSWFNIAENATAATAIMRWCSRAACALELLDQVRGIKPPLETTPEHVPLLPGMPGFGGLSMLAIVALAFFFLSRRR